MNRKTVCITACACAMALFGAAAAAQPEGIQNKAREELRADMADYELPPASELARDVTREIVDAQCIESSPFTASLFMGRADGLQQQPASRPPLRAAVVRESAQPDAGKAPSGLLAWLLDALRKIAGLR